MMTGVDKEIAIAYAQKELREIEQQMLVLARKKASVAHFLEIVREAGADQLPQSTGADESGISSTEPAGRQRNKRWVNKAAEIIVREGKPMAAPDIHRIHPDREEVSNAVLYRLMYNRAASGKLLNLDGYFWPADLPLPEGWKMPDLNDPNRVRPGRKPGASKKGEAA